MIVFENVYFAYQRDRYVLEDFSIEFPRDRVSVILGPNGVGKTTLLRLAAGVLRPQRGSVRVMGRDPREVRGRIGYIPQTGGLYPWMTIRDNIELPLRIRGLERETRRRAVEEVAERLGIGGLLERYPREVSGGEGQKALLARVLVSGAEVLLLDEPFSMIDIDYREEIVSIIRGEVMKRVSTVVVVTHSIEDAVSLGDTVYVVEGRPLRVAGVYRVDESSRGSVSTVLRDLLRKRGWT